MFSERDKHRSASNEIIEHQLLNINYKPNEPSVNNLNFVSLAKLKRFFGVAR